MLNILKPNTIESAVKSLVKAADNLRRAACIRAAESLQYAEQAGKILANLNQLIGR